MCRPRLRNVSKIISRVDQRFRTVFCAHFNGKPSSSITRRPFVNEYYNILHPNRRHKEDIFDKLVGVYYFYRLTTDKFLNYHFVRVRFSFLPNQRGSSIGILVVRQEHAPIS